MKGSAAAGDSLSTGTAGVATSSKTIAAATDRTSLAHVSIELADRWFRSEDVRFFAGEQRVALPVAYPVERARRGLALASKPDAVLEVRSARDLRFSPLAYLDSYIIERVELDGHDLVLMCVVPLTLRMCVDRVDVRLSAV